MGWTCPECGFMNAEEAAVCNCGFDRSVFLSASSGDEGPEDGEGRLGGNPLDSAAFSVPDFNTASRSGQSSVKKAAAEKPRSEQTPDRIMIKEVGAWSFSFSPSDEKISVGTAALDPFRLDLRVEDLEEVIEVVYELSGRRKTLRSLELVDGDVQELVDFIGEMIDAKRSKVRISFSKEDISAIAALVNKKLSQ